MECKLMLSLFNEMCDPCNILPLLPIYYINHILRVWCTYYHKIYACSDLWCFALVWFRLVVFMSFVIAAKMKVPVKGPKEYGSWNLINSIAMIQKKNRQSTWRIENDILAYDLHTD